MECYFVVSWWVEFCLIYQTIWLEGLIFWGVCSTKGIDRSDLIQVLDITVVEVLLLTRGKYHMHWERQTISNVRVTCSTLFSCAFKARNNTADSWTPEAWSDCQTLLTDWQQRHEWRCWFLKTRGTKWHFADASCWDRSYGECFTDAWH